MKRSNLYTGMFLTVLMVVLFVEIVFGLMPTFALFSVYDQCNKAAINTWKAVQADPYHPHPEKHNREVATNWALCETGLKVVEKIQRDTVKRSLERLEEEGN